MKNIFIMLVMILLIPSMVSATAAYQLTNGTSVIRTSDGAVIPDDTSNTDWQA